MLIRFLAFFALAKACFSFKIQFFNSKRIRNTHKIFSEAPQVSSSDISDPPPVNFDELSAENAAEAFQNPVEVLEKNRQAPRQAQWFPMLLSPEALDGTYAGDVGFDPLGFSGDKGRIKWLRSAEVKHARLAMLASVGWPLSELWHKEVAEFLGLESILANGDKAPSIMNGGLMNNWIEATLGFALIIGGILEFISRGVGVNNDDRIPGDFGFDPLRLHAFRGTFGLDIVGSDLTREQKLANAKKDMELCEIKNGRLAMIAITGMAFQEVVTGMPVVLETPIFFGDPLN